MYPSVNMLRVRTSTPVTLAATTAVAYRPSVSKPLVEAALARSMHCCFCYGEAAVSEISGGGGKTMTDHLVECLRLGKALLVVTRVGIVVVHP